MNKNRYRKIFGCRLGVLVAMAETAKARSKSPGESRDMSGGFSRGSLSTPPHHARLGTTALVGALAALSMATPAWAQSVAFNGDTRPANRLRAGAAMKRVLVTVGKAAMAPVATAVQCAALIALLLAALGTAAPALADSVSGSGIPLAAGANPQNVAITPDGSRAYVTNAGTGTVSVIDTAANQTIGSPIALGAGSVPEGVAVTSGYAYVTEYGAGKVAVIGTDPSDPATYNSVVAVLGVGTNPASVALTPDGTRAWVTNMSSGTISIIDTDPADAAVNTVVGTIATPSLPNGFTPYDVAFFTPSSGALTAYVTDRANQRVDMIDAANRTVTGTIALSSSLPEGIAITPDGHAYIASFGGSTVSVIDTSAPTATPATVTLASSGPSNVAITPDGSRVYVNSFASSTVSVIDAATNTIAGTVTVGTRPYGIAITPDGSHAYVAVYTDATVQVITLDQTPAFMTSATLPDGAVGTPYAATVQAIGSPATISYALATGSTLPAGLTLNATTGAITGTPTTTGTSTFDITATNQATTVPAEATRTFSLTVNAVVPGAPTGVSAVAGDGQATVSFTAPASDGGSPITGYTVTATPVGGGTALATTGTSSPITITGLTNGTAYRFTVTATNSVGTGPDSTASSPVTPLTATLQHVIDLVNALPNPVADLDDADLVAQASNTVAALTAAERAQLPASTLAALTTAQSQAGVVNQTDTEDGVAASGSALTWNLRLIVAPRTHGGSPSIYDGFASQIPADRTLLALYDLTIIDTLDGSAWQPPASQPVTITLTQVPVAGHSGFAVLHDNGATLETLTASVQGGTVTFATSTFSLNELFGITADAAALVPAPVPGNALWMLVVMGLLMVVGGMVRR